jgi:hypothetical protein
MSEQSYFGWGPGQAARYKDWTGFMALGVLQLRPYVHGYEPRMRNPKGSVGLCRGSGVLANSRSHPFVLIGARIV